MTSIGLRTWLPGLMAISLVGLLACGGGNATPAGQGTDVGGPVVPAPDLRFKWVGSGFTLKLFTGPTDLGTDGSGQSSARGRQFLSQLNVNGDGTTTYFWFDTAENLEPMIASVTSAPLAGLASDLDGLQDPRAVITALDSGMGSFDQVYNALSSGTDSDAVAYAPFNPGAFAPQDIAAWAASVGARGQVVTALCPLPSDANAPAMIYGTAFGRQGDTATYETQVAITALDGLGAQLGAMAAAGYIITAIGRDGTGRDGAGSFIIVGTRAAGQMTPRTIKTVDVPCVAGGGNMVGKALEGLLGGGYALVGDIFHTVSFACDGSPTELLIGER
jgi:hypothetical protein